MHNRGNGGNGDSNDQTVGEFLRLLQINQISPSFGRGFDGMMRCPMLLNSARIIFGAVWRLFVLLYGQMIDTMSGRGYFAVGKRYWLGVSRDINIGRYVQSGGRNWLTWSIVRFESTTCYLMGNLGIILYKTTSSGVSVAMTFVMLNFYERKSVHCAFVLCGTNSVILL